MTLPAFVSAGTQQNGSGALSVPWGAGHQADDYGFLFVQTANQAVNTPAGWTQAPSSPQGTGTAGAAGSTRISVFYKKATSTTEANVTVDDSGDHQRGVILVFRGCETASAPVSTSAGDVLATADTACSIPGGTTSNPDRLIVVAVANGADVSGNQTTAGGFTNADLANIPRRQTGNTTVGTGGGMDIATGEKAVAGTFGPTTVTLATASAQARIMLALKPPAAPPPPSVTEGGIWFGTGTKATAGAYTATTGTLDSASAQAGMTIALKPQVTPPANQAAVIAVISDKLAAVGVALSFPVTITDVENDTLTVSLAPGSTSVPTGAVINANPDGSYDVSWTPTADQAGEWNFGVRVDETGGTTIRYFTVSVAATPPVNLLEVAQGIADRARVDSDSAQALADLVLQIEQLNAAVSTKTKILVDDLAASKAYMQSVLDELASGTGTTL